MGAASLDDLEDCDNAILPNDGRAGSWYQYLDTFGSTLAPAAFKPEAAGSPVSPKCSVHVRGMTVNNAAMNQFGFAGVGFSFPGNMPIDSSAYDGITFFAKGSGQIRVAVTVPATTDAMFGGTCATNCGDSFGFVVDLTADWKRYDVPWTVARPGRLGHPGHLRAERDDGHRLRLLLGVGLRCLHRRRRVPAAGALSARCGIAGPLAGERAG